MEFVQVRLLTNVSDPFPEKIVRERLDGAIRRLRGAIAGYSFGGTGCTEWSKCTSGLHDPNLFI